MAKNNGRVKTFGTWLFNSLDVIMFSIVAFIIMLLITTTFGEFSLMTLKDVHFWLEWTTLVMLGSGGYHIYGNNSARNARKSVEYRNAVGKQTKAYEVISHSKFSEQFEKEVKEDDFNEKMSAWEAHISNKIHKWVNINLLLAPWKKKKLKYWRRERKLFLAFKKYIRALELGESSEEELDALMEEYEEFNLENVKVTYARNYMQLYTSNATAKGIVINDKEFHLHSRLFEMSIGTKIFSLFYTFLSTTLIVNEGGFTVDAMAKLVMYTFLIGWNCNTGSRNAERLVFEEEIPAINQREDFEKKFIIRVGLIPPKYEVNVTSGGVPNE